MCKVLLVKHVAQRYQLSWDAVKVINRAYLDRTLGEPDLDGLEQIAMDQVAIRKGHILSHCRYPLNTGVLEGINNKIKVIKRMTYGSRDDAYFFLKIRSAFPGGTG